MSVQRPLKTPALKPPNLEPIALYVHIPYCVTKCPYCDFNSYAISAPEQAGVQRRTAVLEEASYTEALLIELAEYASRPEWRERAVQSIFFGGGTPSLFSESAIAELLNAFARHFRLASDCEISLEANPGTVSEQLGRDRLCGFRTAGVNRLSFGAQSFNAEKLRFLGRLHGVTDIWQSLENASYAGFDNYNLDLIYGLPNESAESWQSDLDAAILAAPKHLSAYCLTIEPGTDFDRQFRKGLFKELPSSAQAKLFQQTQAVFLSAGYAQYEISNFALPGFMCKHNLAYWHWSDYLSLGAGAHSFVKIQSSGSIVARRWSNIPKPSHYLERAYAGGNCSQRTEEVDLEQAELEYLLCHLRTAEGIDEQRFAASFGYSFQQKFDSVLQQLQNEDLLCRSELRTHVSARGFLFVDEVLARLAQAPNPAPTRTPQAIVRE